MVTILLQKILDLLRGFVTDFTSWAADVFEKLGFIQEQTENLDDILVDTTNISNNTNSIAASNEYIKSNAIQINNKLTTIQTNSTTIANNSGSIATSAGTAAAFAEDCATNTLNINNRLVTIGSDTTQIRADTTSLAADVAEIKDTLGLYLYNTIVTEDAEGDIASCDTDLKDYLQEAKVTIPADAGGITGINLINNGGNLWDENWELGTILPSTGQNTSSTTRIRSVNYINAKPNTTYRLICPNSYNMYFYQSDYTYISFITKNRNETFTTPANCYYVRFSPDTSYGVDYGNNISLNYPSTDTDYHAYLGKDTYSISFTSITDGAEIDLLTGLIKINTSPVTYDSITPIAIRTYKGVNNIYSDIGTTSVTYRETLKHYLKKQEA